jgi:hypothetical protein
METSREEGIATETRRALSQKAERFFWNAATSALATGRRILQVECYRNRHVPVNIILRVAENTDFIGDAVPEIPNLALSNLDLLLD